MGKQEDPPAPTAVAPDDDEGAFSNGMPGREKATPYDEERVSLFILLMVLDGFLFLPRNLTRLGYGRWAISRTMKRLINKGVVDWTGTKFSEKTMTILGEYESRAKRFVDARGIAEFAYDVYRMENWSQEDIDKFVNQFDQTLKKKTRKASPDDLALLKKFREAG